jgi:hypothetical protein
MSWTIARVLSTLAISGALAWAQVNQANLSGVVTDPAGAAVGGAVITIRNQATGSEREVRTEGNGFYTAPNLSIGQYSVSAQLPGFQTARADVRLSTAQNARLDFKLQVGAVETIVNVEAGAELLSTLDAQLGSTVDNTYVTQFPLFLRSWDDLMNLVAGVQGQRYTEQSGATNAGRGGNFNVHGLRSLHNNFILDGIDNNSISTNVQELTTQVVRPSVDSIEEFRVITNPYSSEYGRAPGAAIVVATRGGTNEYHGLLYHYLRNRVLDANDFFSNRNRLAKPQNVQNQFGGNLGGRLVRDKLFFFFDYEGTRIRRGVSRITTVPLANERLGNFSTEAARAAGIAAYPTIYDPATAQPFPNNIIPQNRLDPVATRLFSLYPQPTSGGVQQNNYARNAGLLDDTDRYNARIDWQPTPNDSIFGRYTYSPRERFVPGFIGGILDATATSAWGRMDMIGHQVGLGWTRPFSSAVVNEMRIGYAKNDSDAVQDPFGQNVVSEYIPGVPSDPAFEGGVSRITFTGINTFMGSPDFLPKFQRTSQWQWSDTLSWTTGAHTVKFGADLRAPLKNDYLDVPGMRGSMNFDRIFTCQRDSSGQCVAGTGFSYADFLLGYVQQAQLTNLFVARQRFNMYSFFAQDDWKISRRLSMNLGLRYDYSSPPVEVDNRQANFDPTGSGSVVTARDGSLRDRALLQPDRNNFGPRVGLAYQLTPRTVLRTGYGIFYSLLERIGSEDQLALNPPGLRNIVQFVGAGAQNPVFLLRNGFPSNYLDPSRIDLTRTRIRAANPDLKQPYVQQWSFGFQQELPFNLFSEITYVGTKGTHLNTIRNLNQPIQTATGPVTPYPNFGAIQYRDPLGSSVYHGMDLTLHRRFAQGVSFRVAYTLGKAIDNTAEHLSSGGSSSFNQNSRDFASWRGPADFDVRHRLVLSYVWELPFGRGKAMLNSGPLAWILGNWQSSGAYTFTTGRPYTVFASANRASLDPANIHVALANVTGQPTFVENVDCWVYSSRNTACRALSPNATDAFAVPAQRQFGNAGRNILRGPGSSVVDFALHRNFPFDEQRSLQFRWEVFNLTNTPMFGLPNTDFSNAAFGQITTLAGDPRVMQFALRLRF